MPERANPFGAFNFQVEFAAAGDAAAISAGFSDVSGLGNEINFSEYRQGNDPVNTVRKIPNTHKLDEVTLKRGLIGSTDIFEWFTQVRDDGKYLPRSVTIVVLDEAKKEAVRIILNRAQPRKWVGPTLAAKGGGEVAMEELHLFHEGIEFESP